MKITAHRHVRLELDRAELIQAIEKLTGRTPKMDSFIRFGTGPSGCVEQITFEWDEEMDVD